MAAYLAFRMRRPGVVRWPLILAAVTWAGFAAWEWECLREQADIRIDLLLIYPFLAVLTLAGLLPSLLSLARGGHRA